MSIYDPLQANRRLWNDPENILNDSLAGTIIMHPNLVYLDSCRAVLRRDLSRMNGKVRIIGGGAMIDGPMYAGFVGPGMLTAAVLGLQSSASSIPSSDSIFEVINHVMHDSQQSVNGILLLVHDCAEYFLNFLLAKTRAENEGIPIRMILVRDEVSDRIDQKPQSPRSPSGLLLVYKIAGAMSEKGKSLDEIYDMCDNIMKNGAIYSTGVYTLEILSGQGYQIEISRGDRLSDREIKRIPIVETSTKGIVQELLAELIKEESRKKFSQGSKLAIMLDYFGGFSELEVNIIIKELVQQLNEFQLETEIIYTGTFHTSIEVTGFHLSILNLSTDPQFSHYLQAPTIAFSWPKTCTSKVDFSFDLDTKRVVGSEKIAESPKSKIDLEKPSPVKSTSFNTDLLLTAVEFACEAVIACASKIDLLDKPLLPSEFAKCGSRLASIAELIKTSVRKKQFVGLSLSSIIFQIARIFEQSVQDPQAELYHIFFNSFGRSIEQRKTLEANDWLDAFVRAITIVDYTAGGTKFFETLQVAKSAYCDACGEDEDVDVLYALGQAVCAAQKQTSHVVPDSGRIPQQFLPDKDCGYSGLAGAHAIGVWMRGAYEGIKLKYSRSRAREKRPYFVEFSSGSEIEVASKMPKLSDDASPF